MRHHSWAAIAVAVGLGACAGPRLDHRPRDGFDPIKIKLQAPCTVNVQIDGLGNASVDAEPVRTSRCPTDRRVFLWLAHDNDYTFKPKPNGITFPANQNLLPPGPPPDCDRIANGKGYRCTFEGFTGYKWKYTISLLKNGQSDAILDPNMIND